MKRIICVMLLIALSFILCGCYGINADTIYIALRDGHNFDIQHLYEEVETENGYDIVVHIVKNK